MVTFWEWFYWLLWWDLSLFYCEFMSIRSGWNSFRGLLSCPLLSAFKLFLIWVFVCWLRKLSCFLIGRLWSCIRMELVCALRKFSFYLWLMRSSRILPDWKLVCSLGRASCIYLPSGWSAYFWRISRISSVLKDFMVKSYWSSKEWSTSNLPLSL